MNKSRINYFIALCIVIVVGLASRQFPIIPSFIGDVLWALMIFPIFRFLFINMTAKSSVLLSLAFCFMIEISQLYQAEWIDNLRHTILGGLILGQGFLWSDIVAYTAGVIIGVLFESILKP